MKTIKKMLLGISLLILGIPFFLIGIEGSDLFTIIGIALMIVGFGYSVVSYLIDDDKS